VKKAAKEDPVYQTIIEQANTAVDAAIKEARNHYSRQLGLYWPNYLESERAANQARFQRMDPKFHRWTGEGSLAIQFQKGLSVAELFECQDSRLRLIHPISPIPTLSGLTARSGEKRDTSGRFTASNPTRTVLPDGLPSR
jgi:hypothetical protein